MAIVIDGKRVEHENLRAMTHNEEINLSKQFDQEISKLKHTIDLIHNKNKYDIKIVAKSILEIYNNLVH